jgi:hypothetical protein
MEFYDLDAMPTRRAVRWRTRFPRVVGSLFGLRELAATPLNLRPLCVLPRYKGPTRRRRHMTTEPDDWHQILSRVTESSCAASNG